jgi:amidohydrolase
MILSNSDLVELTALRRKLHRFPEVSGQERETAARVVASLRALAPDEIITGLGGHGVAAVFNGAEAGPTLLFRAELDALPIKEVSTAEHRSTIDGTGHLCGHDGHMTLLIGLARLLSRRRTARGRVVLMFQPAEEDGSGARAVVADPRYQALRPDWAFAIHNWPGIAIGHCLLASGVVNCASQGLRMVFNGKTSHAAEPGKGLSPALAMARLISALTALGQGGPLDADFRLVTLTHARLGEACFGVAPGEGELWVTLRCLTDANMTRLRTEAVAMATAEAQTAGLSVSFSQQDDFAASVNHPEAVAHIAHALDALELGYTDEGLPELASEDFGVFGWGKTRSAMLFVGAGVATPALHNPDYDFPDDLIGTGVAIFSQIAREMLG